MNNIQTLKNISDLPAVLTVRDLAEFLRLGTNTVYRLLRRGAIQSIRMGRQYRIPKRAVLEYLGQIGADCA